MIFINIFILFDIYNKNILYEYNTMTYNKLNQYYQYSYCINFAKDIITKTYDTNQITSFDSEKLQLLSISLEEINDENFNLFNVIKEIMNILSSYFALLSVRGMIDQDNIELLYFIDFILYILSEFLVYDYYDYSQLNGQDLSLSQINYVLNGSSPILYSSRRSSEEFDKKELVQNIVKIPLNEWINYHKTFSTPQPI